MRVKDRMRADQRQRRGALVSTPGLVYTIRGLLQDLPPELRARVDASVEDYRQLRDLDPPVPTDSSQLLRQQQPAWRDEARLLVDPQRRRVLVADHQMHGRDRVSARLGQQQLDRRRRKALALFIEAAPLTGACPASLYLAARGIDLAELGRIPARCASTPGAGVPKPARPCPRWWPQLPAPKPSTWLPIAPI